MKKINFRKFSTKPFLHFDKRLSVKHFLKNIRDKSFISTHSFYPFIHYTHFARKYNKDKRKIAINDREIYYAGHLDGYIFRYYSEILNKRYNKYCEENDIDDVSIAYRNEKTGKSNIQFAQDVISYITKQKRAFIFVTDFTKYFDRLDHELLKQRLLKVLGINSPRLPSDWWNVFKHITHFSWVNIKEIKRDLKQLRKKRIIWKEMDRFYTPREFREFRKRVQIQRNDKDYGIPQGSAISAVLANVYAIYIDQMLKEFAQKYNGIYRRYSDDVILILPINSNQSFSHISKENFIINAIEMNKIEISANKTKSLYYENEQLFSYKTNKLSQLVYLGFAFDGKAVQIREKSLFRYYHRMYKRIKSIREKERILNRKFGRRKLYELYSHLGRNYKGRGNFITYAERAHDEFSKIDKIESRIYNQIKRHWNKIYRRLNR